jgi:hypothetical protein
MKAKTLLILAALGLAGCATPITILKNPTTGENVRCGGGHAGSAAGGLVGYAVEQSSDKKCVQRYLDSGYVPIEVNGIKVNEGAQKPN